MFRSPGLFKARALWLYTKKQPQRLSSISDRTLSSNLKELEADELIIRTEYPQIPPKVEYTLSARGKSLMKVLDQLCTWGEENRK